MRVAICCSAEMTNQSERYFSADEYSSWQRALSKELDGKDRRPRRWTVHQSSNYTAHDLSPENYKQMVKHLKQLKLLEGISVGDQ